MTRRKLHHAAVGAEALDGLRALLLPIVVVFLLGGGGMRSLVVYGVAGLAFSLVSAYASWSSTWWSAQEGAVRLRSGVFTERIVSVPFDRVQAIDTVRGPAQRLLGGVELHVQTAGGGPRGEIVLKAVSPAEAEELRELVREGGAAAVTEAADDVPAWRLGRARLLVAALTSGSLGVLVPVVAGASQVLDDVLGAEDAQALVPDTAGEALMAAGAVLLVAWVLSVLGTIVAFAGFTVRRDGDRLRISRGIVERREASVPIARIGAIRIVESPLREPLGLAQVRIESAGYAKEPATAQALLPVARRRDVERILTLLVPEFAGDLASSLEPPPRRSLRRFLLPPVAAASVVPAALLPLLGAPALPALALPLAAALFGLAAYRTAGWRLEGDRVVLRRRGLQRTTLVADAKRLPETFTHATLPQRRARIASAGVAVSSGRRVAVPHLETETAEEILGRLSRLAAGSG